MYLSVNFTRVHRKLTENQLPCLLLAKQDRQALAHLVGSFVGERHRGDLSRLNSMTPDEVCDPAGEDSGLPRTRAGKDLKRHLGWRGDG